MARVVNAPDVKKRRIRDLAAAHDAALGECARLLGPPDKTGSYYQQVESGARGYLGTLLAEGLVEGTWTRSSFGKCVLIERCGADRARGELLLRRAPRRAVEQAPEWASAEAIEEKARPIIRSRHRAAFKKIRLVSALALAAVVGVWAVRRMLGYDGLFENPALELGFFAVAVLSWIGVIYTDMEMPEPVEDVLADDLDADDRAGGGASGGGPSVGRDACDEEWGVLGRIGGSPAASEAEATSGWVMMDPILEQHRDFIVGGSYGAPAVAPSPPGSNPLQWNPLGARSSDPGGQSTGGGPECHGSRVLVPVLENNMGGEDLSESFSGASLPAEGERKIDGRGWDAPEFVRVVEARGEIADVLGMERGELVAELRWFAEGGDRFARSFMPYHAVVAGTSLDPFGGAGGSVRVEARWELHEVIRREKQLDTLHPKVTYRAGPARSGYFNRPVRGSGPEEAYELRDKVRYLMDRAKESGFDGCYSGAEWSRMKQITAGRGYATENVELLRFALVAGLDPRYFFEDSGEDLRDWREMGNRGQEHHPEAVAGDRQRMVLWRVEAAVSEEMDVAVEVFERALMPWEISARAADLR